MKPYGMALLGNTDNDESPHLADGRAARVYGWEVRAFRSLRGPKKAAKRRRQKRAARREGKLACQAD